MTVGDSEIHETLNGTSPDISQDRPESPVEQQQQDPVDPKPVGPAVDRHKEASNNNDPPQLQVLRPNIAAVPVKPTKMGRRKQNCPQKTGMNDGKELEQLMNHQYLGHRQVYIKSRYLIDRSAW